MKGFSINIQGRIKNFRLPHNQPLIPLYEAIVNSIHAIEERCNSNHTFKGKIVIKLIRDGQITIDGSGELPSVTSFEIIDNGIGFNDPNMESFMKSDSRYKEAFGGKGVGRFSWLAAFQKAEIESIYQEKTEYVRRAFEFSTRQQEIDDSCEIYKNAEDNQTTIKLLDCMFPYAKHLPKKAETIAMSIIHHCLIYFISENCPEIILQDMNESLNLNSIFREKIQTENNSSVLRIENEEFNLLHVRVEEKTIEGNKLYLCAHNRVVEIKNLEKYITDLDQEIYKESGFWYIGVLSGKYLDQYVNTTRTAFNTSDMDDTVSMDLIMRETVSEIEKFLQDYLTPIAAKKMQRIKDYVTHEAPQFRHLLKYMPDDIAAIKPNLNDLQLDDELHHIKQKFNHQIKDENKRLSETLKQGVLTSEKYIQQFHSQVEKISSANSAVLAEYIIHRKIILNFLESAVRQKEDGNFQKESVLHNLIYPMRATSEDIPYNAHNLWLIDEKLAYCSYIASDIPFNNDPKQERTDIMILDSPVAVSDEENIGTEYGTIILFELKRPMRDDYAADKNPIIQLYNYAIKLRTGKVKDKNGRLIKVGANTQFYLYAICDITESLRTILDIHNFTRTPDKAGYYGYNDKLNAYIEILSYDKIINDAKKRNKVLFETLGI